MFKAIFGTVAKAISKARKAVREFVTEMGFGDTPVVVFADIAVTSFALMFVVKYFITLITIAFVGMVAKEIVGYANLPQKQLCR